MAEAHQGVAFNFAITHEGVHINYDTEVLSVVWQSGVRSNKKRFARFIVSIHVNALTGLSFCFLVNVCVELLLFMTFIIDHCFLFYCYLF